MSRSESLPPPVQTLAVGFTSCRPASAVIACRSCSVASGTMAAQSSCHFGHVCCLQQPAGRAQHSICSPCTRHCSFEHALCPEAWHGHCASKVCSAHCWEYRSRAAVIACRCVGELRQVALVKRCCGSLLSLAASLAEHCDVALSADSTDMTYGCHPRPLLGLTSTKLMT